MRWDYLSSSVWGVRGGCAVRGEICALKRAEGSGGGLCHAAGDMRAYGAREGIAGMYGAGDSGRGCMMYYV